MKTLALKTALPIAMYLLVGIVISCDFAQRDDNMSMNIFDVVFVTVTWPLIVIGNLLP